MAYEIKPNTGSLFKNEKRESDNHPNATGRAMIDGVLYYVSAWTKESKDGVRYQSLAFKVADGPKRETPQSNQGFGRGRSMKDELDSDCPF